MADIRKRQGKKGTSYQVRYPSNSTDTGYAFKTFKTLKQARDFAQNSSEWKQSKTSETVSIHDAIDLWLDICQNVGRDGRETVEPQTLIEYQRRAKVIKEYPWTKTLSELKPPDIRHFRNWLLVNKSRDLARRSLSSFHSVIIEMNQLGHIEGDPAVGISIKSNGRYDVFEDDDDVTIPTHQEARNIFGAIDYLATSSHSQKRDAWRRFRPMFLLAGFTGLRPSEYRGLPCKNIGENSVHVTQRADKTGVIGPVKSRAARRHIVIPSVVKEALDEWLEILDDTDGLVFPTESGTPIKLHNLRQRAWLPLMHESGLMVEKMKDGKKRLTPKYPMNCLRHFFASKLIEKGSSLKYIQTIMGHSKIEITLNHYGHLIRGNEEAYQQTANEMAEDIIG